MNDPSTTIPATEKVPPSRTGELDILNVGAGHIEIRFDTKDPIETTRAARIVQDMLRRGYALFVEGKDKTMLRVQRFHADEGVYIIADGAEIPPETEPEEPIPPTEKRKPGRPRKIKMGKAKVTAIGRSAGG